MNTCTTNSCDELLVIVGIMSNYIISKLVRSLIKVLHQRDNVKTDNINTENSFLTSTLVLSQLVPDDLILGAKGHII